MRLRSFAAPATKRKDGHNRAVLRAMHEVMQQFSRASVLVWPIDLIIRCLFWSSVELSIKDRFTVIKSGIGVVAAIR